MLADIGTKALEPGIFISLRVQLCGYAAIVAKKIKAKWNNKEWNRRIWIAFPPSNIFSRLESGKNSGIGSFSWDFDWVKKYSLNYLLVILLNNIMTNEKTMFIWMAHFLYSVLCGGKIMDKTIHSVMCIVGDPHDLREDLYVGHLRRLIL